MCIRDRSTSHQYDCCAGLSGNVPAEFADQEDAQGTCGIPIKLTPPPVFFSPTPAPEGCKKEYDDCSVSGLNSCCAGLKCNADEGEDIGVCEKPTAAPVATPDI